MSNAAISCFSNKNDNLIFIISELNKFNGSEIDLASFNDEFSFLQSLKNSNCSEKRNHLIIIDIDNCNCETIQFINNVNNLSLSAIKLIVADEDQRLQIQRFAKRAESMQFLERPWDSSNFAQTLDTAIQSFDELSVFENTIKKELSFDEKVEEKVIERIHKLMDANMAKDNFMSIIAHDLKGPFFSLLGISEILLNEWENLTDETKLDLIGDLHKTTDDTHKLLVTLLDWSKLQKEKLEVCVQEVNICNLVNSTLKTTKNNASVKKIKIENKINVELKVKTDRNMIATVFRNLISNAVQYIQPGGKISISATEEKDFCTFCIDDNGAGIDKPHILELFKQGNLKKLNANASAFKGLGLIISKDFVEKNGGQIWLETQKGVGSKFFFTLPC